MPLYNIAASCPAAYFRRHSGNASFKKNQLCPLKVPCHWMPRFQLHIIDKTPWRFGHSALALIRLFSQTLCKVFCASCYRNRSLFAGNDFRACNHYFEHEISSCNVSRLQLVWYPIAFILVASCLYGNIKIVPNGFEERFYFT